MLVARLGPAHHHPGLPHEDPRHALLDRDRPPLGDGHFFHLPPLGHHHGRRLHRECHQHGRQALHPGSAVQGHRPACDRLPRCRCGGLRQVPRHRDGRLSLRGVRRRLVLVQVGADQALPARSRRHGGLDDRRRAHLERRQVLWRRRLLRPKHALPLGELRQPADLQRVRRGDARLRRRAVLGARPLGRSHGHLHPDARLALPQVDLPLLVDDVWRRRLRHRDLHG
mmetsp:Transcript_54499/g.125612  ORF Transcript_54499/g.125612 Transcript_54499/m.125612 type:complete len:226 (+) Transcript_54499:488-1165(+)